MDGGDSQAGSQSGGSDFGAGRQGEEGACHRHTLPWWPNGVAVAAKWCCRGCADGRTGMIVPRGRWRHSCMKQRVVAGWAVTADAP